MDRTLVMGVAPSIISVKASTLHALGIKGVVNVADEFRGPLDDYARYGIKELWLPTADHFEPSLADLKEAVRFISIFKERNEKVYVHCKAGHGRSAAVAFCWLLTQNPESTPEEISAKMLKRRKVRRTLHLQPSSLAFFEELRANEIAEKTENSDASEVDMLVAV